MKDQGHLKAKAKLLNVKIISRADEKAKFFV